MNKIIEQYFRDKSDKLVYLELKEEKDIYIDHGLTDIALPIVSDELMQALQNNQFENEVSTEYIVDGMLYNIAIDPEFNYIKDYVRVLENMLEDPSKYAIGRGIKAMDTDLDKALIFFRAAYLIDPANAYAAYNYARLLWRNPLEGQEREAFVQEAIKILESILKINDNFALSYYELGNIYRQLADPIKAMNYYRHALSRVDEESVREEIRLQMADIEPDALIADAIYHMNRMNYSQAIASLNEAQSKASRYDILYYLGVSYMNQDNFELALDYFKKAKAGGADFATFYVDYVYVNFVTGRVLEALNIASEGLELHPTDLKLRYNRALIYAEIGNVAKAVSDLDFILEYADLSDEFFNQVMIVKDGLLNPKE